MKASRMDRLDFVSAIVLTAFGIAVLVESLRLPRLDHLNVNPYTVPGIVPGMLGAILTLCGLAMLIRSILRGGWRLDLTDDAVGGFVRSASVRRIALVLALTLGYALGLFGWLPFWLATMVFVFAFVVATEAMALGKLPPLPNIAIAAAIAAVTGAGVEFVFERLFYVRLPG
ncbi:MAG: tripartite tricarboxylate transporter TctB family protein [Pseudomonadota bacterium]